jgi:hypothetical protein
MRAIISLACIFFCFNNVHAQIWKESEPQDYHDSIVKIISHRVSGSGSVVKFIEDSEAHPEYYIGLILTASHVIKSDADLFEIRFKSGKKTLYNRVVLKKPTGTDKFNDLGLIRALIPDEVKPIPLSSEKPTIGGELEIGGWGRGELKHWDAKCGGTLLNNDGIIIFSWAVQGDSGGPILLDGEIVGVVCYGNAVGWYIEPRILIVGPIYGSSVNRVKKFINSFTSSNENITL